MMRRRLIACAALASLLAASCGGEKKGEGANQAASKPAAPKAERANPPAPAAEIAGEKIAGTVTLAPEAGAGTAATLALVRGEDDRLGGELALGAGKCAVSGAIQEDVARAWLTCPAAGEWTAKRGTLVGEIAGGRYQGAFAVSDDGAASVVRGTWTAGK